MNAAPSIHTLQYSCMSRSLVSGNSSGGGSSGSGRGSGDGGGRSRSRSSRIVVNVQNTSNNVPIINSNNNTVPQRLTFN